MINRYNRFFITLNEDRKEFSLKNNKAIGSSIIEIQDSRGKIIINIQNLKNGFVYKAFIIGELEEKYLGVNIGNMIVNEKGKANLRWECNSYDVKDTGLSLDKFKIVAILVDNKDNFFVPLVGYKDKEVSWKNSFQIYNKDENKELNKLYKEDYKKENSDIHKKIELDNKEIFKKNKYEEKESLVSAFSINSNVLEKEDKTINNKNLEEEINKIINNKNTEKEINEIINNKNLEELNKNINNINIEKETNKIINNKDNNIEIDKIINKEYLDKKTEGLLNNKEIHKEQEKIKNHNNSFLENRKSVEENINNIRNIYKEFLNINERKENRENKENKGYKENKEYKENNNIHETFKSMAKKFNKEIKELESYTLKENIQREEKESEINRELKYMFKNNAKMIPFYNKDENTTWIRISLKEMVHLSINFWSLMNSSFVVFAFQKYNHLILGKTIENNNIKYILGVPEIYCEKDTPFIKKLGFTSFKYCDDIKEKKTNHGYWLMELDIK